MQAKNEPIKTPFPQRVTDFKQRWLPLLMWSVAALACVWMLAERGGRFEYVGLAQALEYEVSAEATGRIETVVVNVYDEVEAGAVVAKLDDGELAARIERSNATIRQLTAELHATKAELLSSNTQGRADWTNNLRRFQTDEEERRLAALELRVIIESDEIELERLALELERAGPLLSSGLIGQAEHDRIRLLHDEVRRRNEENEFLLAQTEEEYRAARIRREQFERGLPRLPEEEPLLQPLREAIAVESRRLDEIQARREATVLRSPVSGQVSRVLCRRGQTVVPGEPILTVTELTVNEIVTFLSENDDRVVHKSTPVLVSSLSRPDRVAESVVIRLGPGLEELPPRLWRASSVPDYGRAVVIAAVPGLALAPGELANVRFLSDR